VGRPPVVDRLLVAGARRIGRQLRRA
jgi:hypothetical protein